MSSRLTTLYMVAFPFLIVRNTFSLHKLSNFYSTQVRLFKIPLERAIREKPTAYEPIKLQHFRIRTGRCHSHINHISQTVFYFNYLAWLKLFTRPKCYINWFLGDFLTIIMVASVTPYSTWRIWYGLGLGQVFGKGYRFVFIDIRSLICHQKSFREFITRALFSTEMSQELHCNFLSPGQTNATPRFNMLHSTLLNATCWTLLAAMLHDVALCCMMLNQVWLPSNISCNILQHCLYSHV